MVWECILWEKVTMEVNLVERILRVKMLRQNSLGQRVSFAKNKTDKFHGVGTEAIWPRISSGIYLYIIWQKIP